jgi:hypothetical protein
VEAAVQRFPDWFSLPIRLQRSKALRVRFDERMKDLAQFVRLFALLRKSCATLDLASRHPGIFPGTFPARQDRMVPARQATRVHRRAIRSLH